MVLARFKFIIFLILAAFAAACSQEGERQPPAEKVTLQLKWSHQAQFAGFYVAKDKGFYRDENINISFLEGGADVDAAASIMSGKADFAILTPDYILIKQSEKIPLTAIAVIYRKSTVVYLAHADSGILRPSDFIGKTVACKDLRGGVKDFEFQFLAMMNKLKLPIDDVRIVPFEPRQEGFLNRTVDVTPVYYINGAVRLKREGVKLNMIWPDDYGAHFFSDTLAAMPDMIKKKPDLVFRFLKATLKGWRYAVGNPEEAVDITMAYVKNKDRGFQSDMMYALMPLVHTGEHRIGWMTDQSWTTIIRILADQKMLKGPIPNSKQVYTMRFLEMVYGAKP